MRAGITSTQHARSPQPQNSRKGLPGEGMTGAQVEAEVLCQGCCGDMTAGRGPESDSWELLAMNSSVPGHLQALG